MPLAPILQSTGTSQTSAELLLTFSNSTIYLMGISFILGSLFTILMLLILDFIRRHSAKGDE